MVQVQFRMFFALAQAGAGVPEAGRAEVFDSLGSPGMFRLRALLVTEPGQYGA
jgi:hypothetical protein